jgi:hypothetical protein
MHKLIRLITIVMLVSLARGVSAADDQGEEVARRVNEFIAQSQ